LSSQPIFFAVQIVTMIFLVLCLSSHNTIKNQIISFCVMLKWSECGFEMNINLTSIEIKINKNKFILYNSNNVTFGKKLQIVEI
jgi:hypothetical protein